MEYAGGTHLDCRGRLHTAKDGSFGYRAVVPSSYALLDDVSLSQNSVSSVANSDDRLKGPVGELLISQGRHNMRPSHLHMMVVAPGYHKLITALYPEGCDYLTSDAVFGVKKSLVVVCVAFL